MSSSKQSGEERDAQWKAGIGFLTLPFTKLFYSFSWPSQERMKLQHTAGETEIKVRWWSFHRYSGGWGHRKDGGRSELENGKRGDRQQRNKFGWREAEKHHCVRVKVRIKTENKKSIVKSYRIGEWLTEVYHPGHSNTKSTSTVYWFLTNCNSSYCYTAFLHLLIQTIYRNVLQVLFVALCSSDLIICCHDLIFCLNPARFFLIIVDWLFLCYTQ